ncbi:MAG: hypothetical protein ACOYJD_07410 [Christensenellales bacterium]
MTDAKHTPTTSKEDTSRLGWKVSPITGREYYDFGEVELLTILEELDKKDEERERTQAE